jgi:hypothetical protein
VALLDDLQELETARRHAGGTRCTVARLLDSMSAEEASALNHVIDRTDVYASQIARALTDNGHTISAGMVSHHRRRRRGGGCTCPLPEATA